MVHYQKKVDRLCCCFFSIIIILLSSPFSLNYFMVMKVDSRLTICITEAGGQDGSVAGGGEDRGLSHLNNDGPEVEDDLSVFMLQDSAKQVHPHSAAARLMEAVIVT